MPSFRSHARRARLALQPLEARDVPNGTVKAVLSPTGVLTLTGDEDDNVFALRSTPAGITITPDANTTITDATGAGTMGQEVTLGAARSIKIDLKGGADVLTSAPGFDFSVPGPVSIALGDGNNTLALDTSGIPTGHLISLGGLTVTAGDGTDTVVIDGSGEIGSTIGGTTKITLGNGGGTVALNGVHFTAVTVSAGEGMSVLNPNVVTGTNIVVDKTFSAALGNSDPAVLDVTGSTLGGLKVTGNSVTSALTTTTVKTNVTYKALFGAAVFGDGLTVTKNVSVTAANASFQGPTGAAGITVNGNLAVTGTVVTTTSFQTDTLSEVKGNLTVKGGWGNDQFDTNANFKVGKNVTLTLNGGDNTVFLGDGTGPVTVGGKVTVKTGDGTDDIEFSRVTVAGPVLVLAKGGADLLSIEDGSTFQSTFTADLGAGDDTISIAQDTGDPGPPPVPGPVTFGGKARILAGAGNDFLLLGVAVAAGGDGTSKATFTDPTSLIDGGLGLNDFDPTTSQTNLTNLPNW